jgi:DNA-binding ferritin-like protein
MQTLAIKARTMQFVAHSGHNLTTGSSFFGDHSALGGLYETYTKLYDLIVERMISVGEETKPLSLTLEAANAAMLVEETNKADEIFAELAFLEIELRGLCRKYLDQEENISVGVKNLVEQIASDSEDRSYKLVQRLANTQTKKKA